MEELDSKTLIVNLSSVTHKLNSQLYVLNAIASLEASYPLNIPKHTYDFISHKYDLLINSYKIGEIDTDNFITQLMPNINFDDKYFEKNFMDNFIAENKNKLYFLNGINESAPGPDQIKKALLEKAWNKLIPGDSTYCNPCCFFGGSEMTPVQKMQKLIYYSDADRIYFISNTNPLNIYKIIKYFQQHFPHLIHENIEALINLNKDMDSDKEKNIKISVQNKKPEIYLALSYKYHSYKTEQDNKENDIDLSLSDNRTNAANTISTTPALLAELINSLASDKKNFLVISQFDKDLKAARESGITAWSSSEFYKNTKYTQQDIRHVNETTSLLGVGHR